MSADPSTINQDFSGGTSGGSLISGVSNANLVSGVGGLVGAAGSLLGGILTSSGDNAAASGYAEEAQLYNKAAAQAGVDTGLVQAGGAIQLAQLRKQIESTEATATAIEGAGNVSTTGPTAANILAESQREGRLAIGQQNLQTSIEATNFELMQTGYEAQAAGANGAEQAAKTAAKTSAAGGILGAVGSVAGIVSKFL